MVILTAKITEESDMETNIDYDGNENRASWTGEQRKEDQKMKTMKRKHAFVNGEETIWDKRNIFKRSVVIQMKTENGGK